MEMSSNAIFNWLISEIFCEGAYFIRIELKLIRNHADGSENICVRDFIMRKLKRINVPNIQEQLSQSNENRAINKKN